MGINWICIHPDQKEGRKKLLFQGWNVFTLSVLTCKYFLHLLTKTSYSFIFTILIVTYYVTINIVKLKKLLCFTINIVKHNSFFCNVLHKCHLKIDIIIRFLIYSFPSSNQWQVLLGNLFIILAVFTFISVFSILYLILFYILIHIYFQN